MFFQYRGHIVYLCNRQAAFHRAVAGNQYVVLHLPGPNIVAVHQFVEFRRQAVEELLDRLRKLLHFTAAGVGCCNVPAQRLDMNVHLDGSVAQLPNLFLQLGGLAMRFAQA